MSKYKKKKRETEIQEGTKIVRKVIKEGKKGLDSLLKGVGRGLSMK